MSQETIRAAERAAGQVNAMSTYDPDSDQLHEECGVFGVWAPDRDVARLTYFGLRALQHRGQESAGIAVGDGGTVMVRKDLGLLDRVRAALAPAPVPGFCFDGQTVLVTGAAQGIGREIVRQFAVAGAA